MFIVAVVIIINIIIAVIINLNDMLLWGFSIATEFLNHPYPTLQNLYCASSRCLALRSSGLRMESDTQSQIKWLR